MSPQSAGYSGTPLVKKLGIKPSFAVAFVGAPPHFESLLGPLPEGVRQARARAQGLDYIHYFVRERAELAQRIGTLRSRLKPAGMLWISWPKKAAKLPSDLTEDVIRALAIANGLVDVKVCAVDATWSALKLVIPLKQR